MEGVVGFVIGVFLFYWSFLRVEGRFMIFFLVFWEDSIGGFLGCKWYFCLVLFLRGVKVFFIIVGGFCEYLYWYVWFFFFFVDVFGGSDISIDEIKWSELIRYLFLVYNVFKVCVCGK